MLREECAICVVMWRMGHGRFHDKGLILLIQSSTRYLQSALIFYARGRMLNFAPHLLRSLLTPKDTGTHVNMEKEKKGGMQCVK